MHLLDPYGLPPSTEPERLPDEDGQLTTADHIEEEELAREAPSVERLEPGQDRASSDLDAAMRLQDAPTTWLGGDDAAPDAEQESAGSDAEPYAPLTDSGGQGI
jgi:hypothetical protein